MPGNWRADRERFAPPDPDGGRLRPDVLAGEVAVDPVGRRRPGGRRSGRTGPSGRRRRTRCRFIEKHALFTRTGPHGIRQVNVRGLVAAAFTHRDSRAGDPGICTPTLRWRTRSRPSTAGGCRSTAGCCSRPMLPPRRPTTPPWNSTSATVLGVRFAERPGTDPARRPIREIVGVDPRLNHRWSTRRAHINTRRGELAIQFQQDHGRPPTPVEAIDLAQRATLETRDAKHEPQSLTEQRPTWLNEAAAVLGGRGAVVAMVQSALTPADRGRHDRRRPLGQADDGRSHPCRHGGTAAPPGRCGTSAPKHNAKSAPGMCLLERASALMDLLVDEVLDRRSVALAAPADHIEEPEALRRVDG